MNYPDYGMGGVAKLAMVGLVAIAIAAVAVPIGLVAAGWWLWNNVEVRVADGGEPSGEHRP